jgi:pyrroloquinoline quinone biosynthesis protein B
MRVRVLGTAAGGGLPQWNCACPGCARARSAGPAAWRTPECLAISVSDGAWYLVNASADVRAQLLATPQLTPPMGGRDTPLRGVLLTDGELDHVTGLFSLREGARLAVHAPAAVAENMVRVRDLLAPYGSARWHGLAAGQPLRLDGGRLRVGVLPVGDKRPRYAATASTPGPWVVAYRFEEVSTGAAVVYAPSLARWPPGFDTFLAGARCVMLDGTFWTDDEMTTATGHGPTAREMGHLPIRGAGGTLDRLCRHPGIQRIYTHLNNTNPIADRRSRERAELGAAGIEVAEDGMEIHL